MALFACMYYAALRPADVVARLPDAPSRNTEKSAPVTRSNDPTPAPNPSHVYPTTSGIRPHRFPECPLDLGPSNRPARKPNRELLRGLDAWQVCQMLLSDRGQLRFGGVLAGQRRVLVGAIGEVIQDEARADLFEALGAAHGSWSRCRIKWLAVLARARIRVRILRREFSSDLE